ncbi:MAG: hypothetical protein H0U76_01215 [Ktedonobacteraceae bacterium]|nr:hypothetical protein [Ktedonobacteraceae bacterium]MBA3824672.1 hypothetical protein [Ktedonobacterales bacterium]
MYELVFTGQLASYKVGRSRRIPAQALQSFIQQLALSSKND